MCYITVGFICGKLCFSKHCEVNGGRVKLTGGIFQLSYFPCTIIGTESALCEDDLLGWKIHFFGPVFLFVCNAKFTSLAQYLVSLYDAKSTWLLLTNFGVR